MARNKKDELAKQILREIWDCGLQESFGFYSKRVKNHRYMSAKEMEAFLIAIKIVKLLIPEDILAKRSPQKRFSEWYRELQ